MKFTDQIKVTGQLEIILTDKCGNVKQKLNVPNLVVSKGKEYIASRMSSASTTIMSHMAIGDGTLAPVLSDTKLGNELGRAVMTTFTSTGNVISAVALLQAGNGTGSITEAGIFNASGTNEGFMLCRTTFPVVTKEIGDSITISWNIIVS